MPSEPTSADFTADLAALEHRQSLLHAALAAFQAGIPEPQPLGAHGLALYHRLAVLNGEHSIEAVLVHAAGGEISSGFLPLGSETVRDLQRVTADLLIGPSTPQQTESPFTWPHVFRAGNGSYLVRLADDTGDIQPLPLQQDAPAATAEPQTVEPEPVAVEPAAVEPKPAPASDEATPDTPPTAEEVEAIRADLDRIFNRRPTKVKEIMAEFRAFYEVPQRTPPPKAITTRERAQWLRDRIDPILQDIADFDQNVKDAVQEVAA